MKKSKLTILSLLLTLPLTGCYDVGDYSGSNGSGYNGADSSNFIEYYKDYYDSYGSIKLYTQQKSLNSYSLQDSFFSKSTVNELTWEKESYKVPCNEYIYMAFEVKKTMDMDMLTLYFKGDQSVVSQTLYIYMYVLDKDTFNKVPTFATSMVKLDDKGQPIIEQGKEVKEEFDFPDKESSIAQTSLTVTNSSWDYVSIGYFGLNNDENIRINKGQYVILSFYNNTGYGRLKGLEKVSFTALNLIIRANVK